MHPHIPFFENANEICNLGPSDFTRRQQDF